MLGKYISDHLVGFSTTALSETDSYSGLDSIRGLFKHVGCSESVVSADALCFDGEGDEESTLHSVNRERVAVADGEGCLSRSG